MPITFEVFSSDGTIPVILSTGCCGSCEQFWHRSILAGGCRDEKKQGEISISTDRCIFWRLKDKYKSAVEQEISKVVLS